VRVEDLASRAAGRPPGRLPGRCRGVSDYGWVRKILANPNHREHQETMEWLGDRFDPAAFDAASVNAALSKLKL
jgi:hypothetical protein